MSAYIWVEITINDKAGIKEYVLNAPAILAKYGGKYLVRGGSVEVLEGNIGEHPIKVLHEFPDQEAALKWYHSPEYQALHPIRTQNSHSNYLLMAGIE